MKHGNEKQSISPSEIGLGLEDLIRQGARQVIEQAISAELAQLLEQYENVKTFTGHRAIVRNGYLPAREVLTARGRTLLNDPTDWLSVLNNNSFDMHLMSASGATFRTYVGAVAVNYFHSGSTDQPITAPIMFQARDVLDANGISVFH